MKRLEILVPAALLDDVGVLSERFFRNNASVEVLQSFAVRPSVAALIVRVRRRGPFKDSSAIRRESRAIVRRYRLERFEVLFADAERGEYLAWIEWTLPELLRGPLGGWSGVVPLEVTRSGPDEVRVVFLAPEAVLPRLRGLLDGMHATYRIRAVRTPAAATWQPLAGLTGRQRSVLELAFRLGYYDSPAKASLQVLAARVGITRAGVSKHLRAAERKLLTAVLGIGVAH